MRTADAVEKLRLFFERRSAALAAVYLFGSVARGTASPTSDIAVRVLMAEDPPLRFASLHLDLEADLASELGVPTDPARAPQPAPPDLVPRVRRDGILIAERDRAARVRFEVRARNGYFDLKPILDRYRAATASRGMRS